MDEKDNREVGDIATNILVHCQMLVAGLDDLEGHPTIFRQNLKQIGNRFKNELEGTINKVHDNIGKDEQENRNVLKCYDDYLLILFQLDKLNVNERNRLKEALPDLVEKLKLNKKLEIDVCK